MSLVRFRVRAPYSEEPAYGGFFAFWGTDSPSNCVRLFGLKTSPCGPALKRCSTRRQRRLSESGRPIQKNPPMAGFCFSGTGLSIEPRSILRLHSVSHGLSTIIPTTTEPICGKPPLGQPIVAFACAEHVCKRSKYSAEITAAPDKTDPLHRPWVYSAERDLIHPDISLMKNMIIF